jgi:hypothetical protein
MGRIAVLGWLGLVVIAAQAGPVGAQVELPPPVYRVNMGASYDPATQQLEGVERIRWRNTSSAPVDELQFHLYLNAFANNRSTFMVGSGGQLRGIAMDERRWGWIEVAAMRLAYGSELAAEGLPAELVADPFAAPLAPAVPGEPGPPRFAGRPDLKAVEQFIQPDDGNPEDRTVARYPLPRPLAPGEWVELEIEFSAQMPEIFARTGAHGDFVLGGQWFPKIGVFEDAGMRGRAEAGWNTHQFHANSEFYADFGDYDVRLELPARYAGRIGATGRLLSEEVDGDSVRARFVQEGVHDFAWTADPRFIVVEDRFDPDRDVPPEQAAAIAATLGLGVEELRLQPVAIRLLLQPAHRGQAERYMEAAKVAIRGYGLRLGAYPWETLTMVDPPRGGFGAGGMEYPTFITLGTHPLLEMPGFTRLRAPESVTVHEFGHNFFQGMIASNEFEEAWIDEGMNSYYEAVVMDEHYGGMIELFGLRATSFELDRLQLGDGAYRDRVAQPAWSYRTSGSYGLNSYARPAVTLRHLENLLGAETFHRAMRRFFQTWRFRHPATADFERIIEEESPEDLSWFLEQALHSDRSLDYAVRSVRSSREPEPRGWFRNEDGELSLLGEIDRPHGIGEPPPGSEDSGETAAEEPAEEDEEDDRPYLTEVTVDRLGEFVHPVTVELVFEDGACLRRSWDGRDRWVRYRMVRPAKLVSVEIDPERLMLLDVDPLNNSRRLEPDRTPAAKVLVHLMFWLQNLFALSAVVG